MWWVLLGIYWGRKEKRIIPKRESTNGTGVPMRGTSHNVIYRILQLIGRLKHAALNTHVMVNWQLSKQGIRWLVWREHHRLRFRAHELTTDQALVFNLIVGSCQVNLLIRAGLFWRYTNVFHCFCFVQFEIIETQNRRPNRVNSKSHRKVTKLKSKFSLILG